MIPAFLVGVVVIGVLLDMKPGAIAVAAVLTGAMVGLAHMFG